MEVDLGRIRFEAILGIAGVLMLIGCLAPWETLDNVSGRALESWHGPVTFVGSWLIIFGAVVRYNLLGIWELRRLSPYTDIVMGGIGALLGLIGAFAFLPSMSPGASISWGFYLTIIAGFLALFSAFMVYRGGRRGLPKRVGG